MVLTGRLKNGRGSSVILTKEQVRKIEEKIEKKATAEIVARSITSGGLIDLLSVAQAGGVLNVGATTLRKLDIPSVDISGNGSVSYRFSDLKSYMEGRVTK